MQSAKSEGPTERELTPLVLVLGVLLSLVMGAANVYVGLKAGMTVSASIPAAVMAMLVLRVVLRRGSVLQANQVQTCASAGESLAAGIIFTVPALVLAGAWSDFDYLTTTAIAVGGGLLGVLFMIPMRRVFITDNGELPYPEGLACAAVLEAGDGRSASSGAGALLGGGLLGVLFKVGIDGLGLIATTVVPACGAVLANGMFLASWPAVAQARTSKQLGALNPLPFAFTFANCLGWLHYGFVCRNHYVFWSNALGCVLGLLYTTTALKLGSVRKSTSASGRPGGIIYYSGRLDECLASSHESS